MITGFKAYWVYCCCKIHFTNNKYNIIENGLVQKDRFLNVWNTKRHATDGKLFLRIEEKFQRNFKKFLN